MSTKFNPYESPNTGIYSSDLEPQEPVQRQMQKVGKALGLIYWSFIIPLLVIILGSSIFFAFLSMGLAGDPPVLMLLAAGLGAGLLFIALLLRVVGTAMCLSAPPESHGRRFVLAALALIGVSILVQIADALIGLPGVIESMFRFSELGSGACFVGFLKGIANFIGRPELATRGQRVLNTLIILLVSAGLAVILTVVLPLLGALMWLVFAITLLVLVIMYVNLINDLRNAIVGGGVPIAQVVAGMLNDEKVTPDEEQESGEPIACLECGALIDGGHSQCSKCGWSFTDVTPLAE